MSFIVLKDHHTYPIQGGLCEAAMDTPNDLLSNAEDEVLIESIKVFCWWFCQRLGLEQAEFLELLEVTGEDDVWLWVEGDEEYLNMWRRRQFESWSGILWQTIATILERKPSTEEHPSRRSFSEDTAVTSCSHFLVDDHIQGHQTRI